MATMELAVSMGLAKVRKTSPSANTVPLHNQSTVADSVATNRLPPAIPHSQTWALSQEANKRSGMCSVCFATRQIHVKDGTIHRHGPRNNPCPGSDQLPASDTLQSQQSQQSIMATQPPQSSTTTDSPSLMRQTVISVDLHTAIEPLMQHVDSIQHPIQDKPILKRIPKGARPAVSNLLIKLIQNVLSSSSTEASWSKLLYFSTACLAKPNRGGKSRNLTTNIIKQVRLYDTQVEPSSMSSRAPIRHISSTHRLKPLKSPDQIVAMLASAKLEDGDVKGAVRLLCSDDKLITPDTFTFNQLSSLHPRTPEDRRPSPTSDAQPLRVLPEAVKAAIQSFPSGSSAGPDGLRPHHLKDLITGITCEHPLLLAITDLLNIILEGKTPISVRRVLFGATLLALTKKNGGVRPIAVGYLWRRLAAKVACSYVKEASATLLAPRQLGFGVPGGIEAAVHATRRYVEHMKPGHVLAKIDFTNAFNTLRRDCILEAVAKHFPELLPFVSSTVVDSSDLQFGEYILQSQEGAQQGDPLGPLYFCLVFKDILQSLRSELVLGYLDDVTMGGDASTVAADFIELEAAATTVGLVINRSKCEIIGHTDETRALFADYNIILPETNSEAATLLGAPLFPGQTLDSVLGSKRLELQLLTNRLSLMPSHDSLYLLRNILTAPRLMFLLRTAPCANSPELLQYDEVVREALSTTLNIDLADNRWNQASLPIRWGGLGIRSVAMLAPSAYLASAASTTELTSSLLPSHLRDIKDSHTPAALIEWSSFMSSPSSTLPPPASKVQRDWDNPCCRVQYEKLLNDATDPVDRARLLASCSPGSGDWLHALPLSSVGLKMDNASVRIAAGLRLGAPVVRPHVCVCGATVAADGHHGLSCRHGSGRHSRHDQLNDLLRRAFISSGTLATREPHGLCTSNGKRPDGVTQIPWRRGRCLAWDATCPDTFAACHVTACSDDAGSAAANAEIRKCHKYEDIISGVDFVPVAIETSGAWGQQAIGLTKEIGRRIAAITHDNRATSFLRQRLSIAIQRGNATCILGTLSKANVGDKLAYE